MTGTIYDYDSTKIYIMSGEKRIIIFFKSDEEYQEYLANGMRIDKQVIFNKNKIISFF
mgnify:CR=1 FL=1